MIIAEHKKKTNIAEYVLYMWQIEDMIRANNFDIKEIEKNIISKFSQAPQIITNIKNWYLNIIEMMNAESKRESGHLQIVNNIIIDLADLHTSLLKSPNEQEYLSLYQRALPEIKEFQIKFRGIAINDIELCFNGLYFILLLRLQKREITKATSDAILTFSNLISHLSQKYHKRNVINSKSAVGSRRSSVDKV
jgi:hypothetical protein